MLTVATININQPLILIKNVLKEELDKHETF